MNPFLLPIQSLCYSRRFLLFIWALDLISFAHISTAGGVANLSKDHLQVVTTLRNVTTPLSITINLLTAPPGGWRLHTSLPFVMEHWWVPPCAGNHCYHEFVDAVAVSCPEDFFHTPLPTFRSFCPPISLMLSLGADRVDVLFRDEHEMFTYESSA